MSKPTYDQIFSSLVVYRLLNGEGTLPPKIQDIAAPDQVAEAVREVELGLADLKAEAVLAAAERIRTYADKADGVRFTEHEVADAGGVMLLREYAKSIIDDAKGVTGTVDADLVSETLEAEAAAIQTAAEALARREPMRSATAWENLHEFERSGFRESARAALVAAQGVAPAVTGSTSDGYHTFDELYEYRMLYNAHAAHGWLAAGIPVVKSWRHSDGEECFGGGWFIVTATLPSGQVSNHYKAEHWELFKVPEVDLPPEYDGHTPQVAAERLRAAQGAAPQAESEYEHLLKARALHQTNAGLPSSGVDEDALAEVIEAEIDKLRHETRLYPDIYKTEVARAVVEWLKGQGRR